MFFDEYTVIKAGHTHAGKELSVGEKITLRSSVADRFPEVFSRVGQKSVPSAARVSTGTKSKPEE